MRNPSVLQMSTSTEEAQHDAAKTPTVANLIEDSPRHRTSMPPLHDTSAQPSRGDTTNGDGPPKTPPPPPPRQTEASGDDTHGQDPASATPTLAVGSSSSSSSPPAPTADGATSGGVEAAFVMTPMKRREHRAHYARQEEEEQEERRRRPYPVAQRKEGSADRPGEAPRRPPEDETRGGGGGGPGRYVVYYDGRNDGRDAAAADRGGDPERSKHVRQISHIEEEAMDDEGGEGVEVVLKTTGSTLSAMSQGSGGPPGSHPQQRQRGRGGYDPRRDDAFRGGGGAAPGGGGPSPLRPRPVRPSEVPFNQSGSFDDRSSSRGHPGGGGGAYPGEGYRAPPPQRGYGVPPPPPPPGAEEDVNVVSPYKRGGGGGGDPNAPPPPGGRRPRRYDPDRGWTLAPRSPGSGSGGRGGQYPPSSPIRTPRSPPRGGGGGGGGYGGEYTPQRFEGPYSAAQREGGGGGNGSGSGSGSEPPTPASAAGSSSGDRGGGGGSQWFGYEPRGQYHPANYQLHRGGGGAPSGPPPPPPSSGSGRGPAPVSASFDSDYYHQGPPSSYGGTPPRGGGGGGMGPPSGAPYDRTYDSRAPPHGGPYTPQRGGSWGYNYPPQQQQQQPPTGPPSPVSSRTTTVGPQRGYFGPEGYKSYPPPPPPPAQPTPSDEERAYMDRAGGGPYSPYGGGYYPDGSPYGPPPPHNESYPPYLSRSRSHDGMDVDDVEPEEDVHPLLRDYHPGRDRDLSRVGARDEATPVASNRAANVARMASSDAGILPPPAANEVDFEVTKPPATPVTPPSTDPDCATPADVNDQDVLCGRGGGTNSQVGNRRFRKLVQDFQPFYLMARRKEKPLIARSIVLIIRKRGGRFLKKNEDTGEMFDVGDAKAEAKTSQALREGLDVRATKSAADQIMGKGDKRKKAARAHRKAASTGSLTGMGGDGGGSVGVASQVSPPGPPTEDLDHPPPPPPPAMPPLNPYDAPQDSPGFQYSRGAYPEYYPEYRHSPGGTPRDEMSTESYQFRKRRRALKEEERRRRAEEEEFRRSQGPPPPPMQGGGGGGGGRDPLLTDFSPPRPNLGRGLSPPPHSGYARRPPMPFHPGSLVDRDEPPGASPRDGGDGGAGRERGAADEEPLRVPGEQMRRGGYDYRLAPPEPSGGVGCTSGGGCADDPHANAGCTDAVSMMMESITGNANHCLSPAKWSAV